MPLVNPRSLLRILCIGFAISLTVAAEPSVLPAEITIESTNGSLTLICRPHGISQSAGEGDLYTRCSLEISEDGGETWLPTDTTLSSEFSYLRPEHRLPLDASKPLMLCRIVTSIDMQSDLVGLDFSGADLTDIDLSGADLTDAQFHDALMERANLSNCHLTGANFSQTIMHDAILTHTTGDAVIFYMTKMDRVNLNEATFTNADFRNAKMNRSSLQRIALYLVQSPQC